MTTKYWSRKAEKRKTLSPLTELRFFSYMENFTELRFEAQRLQKC